MRVLGCLLVLCSVAVAGNTFHTGIDVRTDLGTHHARLPLGVRWERWGATVVLDPMYLLDGEHDLDLLGEHFFGPRIGVLFGWRWSAIGLANRHHHQHRSLVGVTAVGPEFFSGRVQTSASLELAMLLVKHGGGTPTQWIAWDRSLLDHFAFGLFARIEYALAI